MVRASPALKRPAAAEVAPAAEEPAAKRGTKVAAKDGQTPLDQVCSAMLSELSPAQKKQAASNVAKMGTQLSVVSMCSGSEIQEFLGPCSRHVSQVHHVCSCMHCSVFGV